MTISSKMRATVVAAKITISLDLPEKKKGNGGTFERRGSGPAIPWGGPSRSELNGIVKRRSPDTRKRHSCIRAQAVAAAEQFLGEHDCFFKGIVMGVGHRALKCAQEDGSRRRNSLAMLTGTGAPVRLVAEFLFCVDELGAHLRAMKLFVKCVSEIQEEGAAAAAAAADISRANGAGARGDHKGSVHDEVLLPHGESSSVVITPLSPPSSRSSASTSSPTEGVGGEEASTAIPTAAQGFENPGAPLTDSHLLTTPLFWVTTSAAVLAIAVAYLSADRRLR